MTTKPSPETSIAESIMALSTPERLRLADALKGETVHGLMVAPDVWNTLVQAIPTADVSTGSALIVGVEGLRVTICKYLSPGQVIPVDRNGAPILRRKTGR